MLQNSTDFLLILKIIYTLYMINFKRTSLRCMLYVCIANIRININEKNFLVFQKRPTIETDHIEEEDSIVCEVKFKGDEFTNLLQVYAESAFRMFFR